MIRVLDMLMTSKRAGDRKEERIQKEKKELWFVFLCKIWRSNCDISEEAQGENLLNVTLFRMSSKMSKHWFGFKLT